MTCARTQQCGVCPTPTVCSQIPANLRKTRKHESTTGVHTPKPATIHKNTTRTQRKLGMGARPWQVRTHINAVCVRHRPAARTSSHTESQMTHMETGYVRAHAPSTSRHSSLHVRRRGLAFAVRKRRASEKARKHAATYKVPCARPRPTARTPSQTELQMTQDEKKMRSTRARPVYDSPLSSTLHMRRRRRTLTYRLTEDLRA